MTQPTRPKRTIGTRPLASARAAVTPPASARRSNGGFFLLPFIVEPPAPPPASDAGWAWTTRRLARLAVWLLPGYAIWTGLLGLTGAEGVTPAAYLAADRPLYVVGWVAGTWLGLLALLALVGLLVATRSRRAALSGFLTALGGALLALPFAGLSNQSAAYGTDVRVLAVLGAIGYSAGWMLTGWALLRSGVFSFGDGVLLLLAGPLLGIGGLIADSLHTIGAILVLTAGIGVGWRAGRLVPAIRSAARAVVAGATAPGQPMPGTASNPR